MGNPVHIKENEQAQSQIEEKLKRGATRNRKAMLTAATSGLAKIFSVSTGLITVPLTLHHLGTERYGMWMTLSTFSALLSFADLGIGNGLMTSVAKAVGRDDVAEIKKLISSAYAFLLAIGVFLATAIITFGPYIPWEHLFNVKEPLAISESRPAAIIFLLSIAAQIPASIVMRVQMATQEGFRAAVWQCCSSLLTLAAVVAAIKIDASLPIIVFALVATPVFVTICNTFLYFGITRSDLVPAFNLVNKEAVSSITKTGLLYFLLQGIASITYASDNLIIAQAIGASAVATFSVAEKLFSLVSTAIAMMLTPLWPAYGEAVARGDSEWAQKTLRKTIQISCIGAGLASAGLLILAPKLISFWIKDALIPPFSLLLGFAIWKTVESTGLAFAVFLNGHHIVKAQVATGLVCAVAAIVAKLWIAKSVGVTGVPYAMATTFVLFSLTPLAIIALRRAQNE